MKGRYALVKSAEAMARDFLPPEKRPAAYGYPAGRGSARYRGLGREERDLYDPLAPDAPEEALALVDRMEQGDLAPEDLFADAAAVRLYAAAFDDAEDYECLYLLPDGAEEAPCGAFLGYDVGYAPAGELFSAVADLFFYPLWHGADPTGQAYRAEYRALNANGLFDAREEAAAFLARYAADFHESDLMITGIYAAEV